MSVLVCVPSRQGLVVVADRRACRVDVWTPIGEYRKIELTPMGGFGLIGIGHFFGPENDPWTYDQGEAVVACIRRGALSLSRDEDAVIGALRQEFFDYVDRRGGIPHALPGTLPGGVLYEAFFFEHDERLRPTIGWVAATCEVRQPSSVLLGFTVHRLADANLQRSILSAFGFGAYVADRMRSRTLPSNLASLADYHARHVLGEGLGDTELDDAADCASAAFRYVADVNKYLRYLEPGVGETVGSRVDALLVTPTGGTEIVTDLDISAHATPSS